MQFSLKEHWYEFKKRDINSNLHKENDDRDQYSQVVVLVLLGSLSIPTFWASEFFDPAGGYVAFFKYEQQGSKKKCKGS